MKGKTLTGDPPARTALQRGRGWGPRTSHLPLVSLEDEHESQRQAQRGQGHEQHARPVVPQGEHLAGGVDVGPHHHIENLREAGATARSGMPVLVRGSSTQGDTLLTPP